MNPTIEAKLRRPGFRLLAFTLIELLVIISLLALLAAMLAPALARTSTRSPALQCMNNARQIAMGWIMYADDNGGALVPNSDGLNTGRDHSDKPAWVGGWLDFSPDHTDNTNTAMLVNHDLYPYGAYLGPYVGNNPSVFKCPGDHTTALEGNMAMPRVRSISMNGFTGNPTRTYNGSTRYPLFNQKPQIMSPAELFVTLDEHPYSINDGWFATAPDILYQLVDYPAGYHANGAGFSFADGHTEIHRWRDYRTCPPPTQMVWQNVSLPGDKDIFWLDQHAVGLAAYP